MTETSALTQKDITLRLSSKRKCWICMNTCLIFDTPKKGKRTYNIEAKLKTISQILEASLSGW